MANCFPVSEGMDTADATLMRVAKGGTFQQFGVTNEAAAARISSHRIDNQEIRIIGSMAVLHSFERPARRLTAGRRPRLSPEAVVNPQH